ncbi:hydrolase [Peribacillus saganii]|uniref:Hydrolase n=1 Tax=Peribacillus saganii TaxID=2303992 RepID=A0A372LP94_9BACI|nr:hydrolase [Peribacillus saganii]RFU69367.1 hydrolase [Peribacillus saganii]
MEQEKRVFYVDIENAVVLENPVESETQFKIFGTDDEVARLRTLFEDNGDADFKTYETAHIPFLEYSKHEGNLEYDQTMIEIYALIYQLGDAEAKRHIESMGILQGPIGNNAP